MHLFLKQKVFSWGDKFTVYNANGEDLYYVRGEVFTLGKKLHIYDLHERELAFIHQKLISFMPKYFIDRNGGDIAEIVKKFTFFKHLYVVNEFGWTVRGDFLDHNFSVYQGDEQIVSVAKRWLSWGDTYEISIAPGIDEINALAVVLVIDACIAAEQNAAANS